MYSQTASTQNPQFVGSLLDISHSMSQQVGIDEYGERITKIDTLKDALEYLFGEIMCKSRTRHNGQDVLRPRFHLTGFLYGGTVRPLYPKEVVTPEDLNENMNLNLVPGGGTPMCQAAQEMLACLEKNVATGKYSNSFPPIIFVMSDGESNDNGDPSIFFRQMQEIRVKDGQTLVVTSYLSSDIASAGEHLFREEDSSWPEGAKIMFRSSSQVPDPVPQAFLDYFSEIPINGRYLQIKPGDRLFFPVNDTEGLAAALGIVGSSAG